MPIAFAKLASPNPNYLNEFPERMLMKFAARAAVAVALSTLAITAAAADGKAVYDKTCTVCHAAGVAGAPKLGDKAAWAPRVATGKDALVASVVKGKGAMPPKAGNAALTEDEIKAAIDFMVAAAK